MANSMDIDSESAEWTPNPSKLNSAGRTCQLTELKLTLANRLVHADPRETVVLSKELTRVSDMLAAISGGEGDEVERARQSYQSKAGSAGAADRHLSLVPHDGGTSGNRPDGGHRAAP